MKPVFRSREITHGPQQMERLLPGFYDNEFIHKIQQVVGISYDFIII